MWTRSKVLDYCDVYLDPAYSDIPSRSCDSVRTDIEFLGNEFNNPVIPANMAATSSFELAKKLDNKGYFYILHRFYDYDEIFSWIKKEKYYLNVVSLSVGVKTKDRDFIDRICSDRQGIDYITIDVSHGHHSLVRDMIAYIKARLNSKIIAGNVTTKEACLDLKKWGVDAVKIGIARGNACTTYNNTGVGTAGHFSSILDCKKAGLPIIADGGIREIGDISKALVAGASMVMCGRMFAACKDSPAEEYEIVGGTEKIYFGSASAKNKGTDQYVEGRDRVLLTPNNLTYIQFMDKINQGLRSTMSFGGFRNIKDLIKMKYSYK